MNIGWLLFGFQGRINRAKFWLTVPISLIILFMGLWIIDTLFDITLGPGVDVTMEGNPLLLIIGVLALFVVLAVSSVAVGIKRLHDRDKSGWWLLLFYLVPELLDRIGARTAIEFVFALVSLGLSIWAIVELGIRRGTAGPNRYGSDPLKP